MAKMRSKKGLVDIVLTPTFVTLLVLGMILSTMLIKINAIGSSLSFEKKFLATDMGVSINALHAIKGNAYIHYSGLGKHNLSYSLGPNVVEVFEGKKKDEDKKIESYYFTEDGPQGIFVRHKDLVPKKKPISDLHLVRQGDEISIESKDVDGFRSNLKRMQCPKKRFPPFQSLVIDPGQGYDKEQDNGETGFTNPSTGWRESKLNTGLANRLKSLFKYLPSQSISDISSTRSWTDDEKVEMSARLNNVKQKEAVISVHHGSYTDISKNPIIAYYNINSRKKEQSVRLGCKILNALSDVFPQLDIALVPVNVEHKRQIDSNSQFSVLLEDKVAVLLELGNIQKPSPNFIIDQQMKITEAISEGVSDYQNIE